MARVGICLTSLVALLSSLACCFPARMFHRIQIVEITGNGKASR